MAKEKKDPVKRSNAPQKTWGKNPESEAVVKTIAEGKAIDEEIFKKMKIICMNIVQGKE